MEDVTIPLKRLQGFRQQLGLSGKPSGPLFRYAGAIRARAREFSDRVYDRSMATPQLRIVLESLPDVEGLRAGWAQWLTDLLTYGMNDDMVERVWRSGKAHVAHNLDHRQISLSYSLARSFLHEAVAEAVPPEDLAEALHRADRLVDYCLLIETDAYVTFTTRCEMEVIEGVAHQLRNPIAVIAGQARKLSRLCGPDLQVSEAATVVIEEARRLERLAAKVSAYMAAALSWQENPIVSLRGAVAAVLTRLDGTKTGAAINVRIDEAADLTAMSADDLDALLFAILANAFENRDRDDPRVEIGCRFDGAAHGYSTLTVDNYGRSFDAVAEKAFTPFHSDAPAGTGMDLATARRVVRKYSGNIALSALPGGGTRCAVTLPVAEERRGG